MRRITLPFLLVIVLAACGGMAATTTTPAPATTTTTVATTTTTEAADFPVTVEADNGSVTIERRPERIVSISPTGTEMLFAIGAGSQVVAVDNLSYHPVGTPLEEDLSAFSPNLEAILEFEPDLVVASFDPDNLLNDGLSVVGVPLIIYYGAAGLDDVYTQIEALGVATGNRDAAEDLVRSLEVEIAAIVADAGGVGEGLTFFHEVSWDFGFYAASSYSFTGQVYSLFGMTNIADEADPDMTGFPEMSPEYVVATDPDLVFVVYSDPESVGQRPGWSELTAVVNGAVIAVDEDLSSRWGPRVVDFVREIAAALASHG